MAIVQFGYKNGVANDEEAPNRIRELREALGLTQAELAEQANVTPSALNKIEKGTRGLDQNWMYRLAPLLGVTPAELLPSTDMPYTLNKQEEILLTRYRKANERDRHLAETVLDYRAEPPDREDEAA